jgi:hypothetical protein
MAIETTIMEIVSTGQEFTIPGDWSPEQLVATYGSNITGLSSMASEVTTEGSTKRIVFRPRTGTKG